MSTLLLSDLHLPAQPSSLRDDFLAFLGGPARDAERVYLLGDLFEYWIGDDIGLLLYAQEIQALSDLSDSGVEVFVQHGNRDFLLGRAFERASGARLIADPVVVDLQGQRTLLSHGDLLCTDDTAYLRWRRFSHHPFVRRVFLALPRSWRLRIAGDLRKGSRTAKRSKSAVIMDVNEAAVCSAFEEYRVDRMIHGHTHRPENHRQVIGRHRRERIVLADWHDHRREYLEVTRDGLRRVNLRAAS